MIFAHTEFYYCSPNQITDSIISLGSEESKHLIQVMRHNIGDKVFVTNGNGNVFEAEVTELNNKNSVLLNIVKKIHVQNKFPNITFFLPILKSQDRFEFALEKCIELGITNFVVYSAEKSHKRGAKLNRWNKIAIAAMKQSLHAHLPKIEFTEKLSLTEDNTRNLIFDQLAEVGLKDNLEMSSKNGSINFIFGPEAGLTESELNSILNKELVKLTDSRLRAETAIVSAASILSSHL